VFPILLLNNWSFRRLRTTPQHYGRFATAAALVDKINSDPQFLQMRPFGVVLKPVSLGVWGLD
jgi:hypothetical protein